MCSASANAALVDFTDSVWRDAMQATGRHSATVGNVTLTAGGHNWWYGDYLLTFNGSSSERAGCLAGQASHGLSCDGDGIGIKNDEISQSGWSYNDHDQSITISFAQAVDVTNLFVLDLFGSERSGEIAVINGMSFQAPDGNLGIPGGFYATGYSGTGIRSILLTGNTDWFSDYTLAGIEFELSPASVSTVPLPGAFWLFSTALLGFFARKQFAK